MALVNNMSKISRNAKVHDEVDATFNVISKGGKNYVQINTYGSKNREAKGVVSQTIQFSEDAVKQLHEIIQKEFN
jgi:hypothetical protein